jgi:hypothetical protein
VVGDLIGSGTHRERGIMATRRTAPHAFRRSPSRISAWTERFFTVVQNFCNRRVPSEETIAPTGLQWHDILSPSARREDEAKKVKESSRGIYDYVLVPDSYAINFMLFKYEEERKSDAFFGWTGVEGLHGSRSVFRLDGTALTDYYEKYFFNLWSEAKCEAEKQQGPGAAPH